MRNGQFPRASLSCLLCVALFLAGCSINISGCALNAKHQKTVRLSAPMSPGSTFAAETHNGSITANGADVTDCNLVATITARARTEEEAIELAEKVKVSLESVGGRLVVSIEKPINLINKSVSVSLDATIPNRADLELVTHNGSVSITEITGRINAKTHNGKVETTRVSDSVKLVTHNGSITCVDASGDANLKTHNGSVKVYYCDSTEPVDEISIVTYNGSIELATPPDLSAKVEAKTDNGSINTDLPITVSGKVSKNRLTGTIASGEGRLYLETHNGSIKLR